MHRLPFSRVRLALTFLLIVLGLTFTTSVMPAHAAATFTFDACAYSGSGSTWTSSTGGSNATLVGTPTFSSTNGSYFQLNGSSQYISIPHSSTVALSTSVSRTIQVWIKPTSLPSSGSYAILGKLSGSYGWDGYFLTASSDGTLTSVTNGSGIARTLTSSAGAISSGQWQLITFISQITSTSNSTRVYVNNTQVMTGQHGTDSYSESNDLRIGSNQFNEYFPSHIGAVYVYDRAVSTTEISDTYTSLSNRVSSNGCTQTIPSVTSFTSSQSSPTNDSSVTYSLSFSEAVTGVTASDFSNAGSATGCTFSPSSDASSSSRTVVVTGCGNGTLLPRFAQDGATNGTSSTGPTSATNASTTITFDFTAPTASLTAATITTGANAVGQSTETGTAYLVNNSVSVNNLASITSANGALWNSVSITTANSNTSISTAGLNDGNYRLFAADAAGNLSTGSSNIVEIDSAAPSASWSSPSTPTSSRSLSYGLQFSKAVTGISAGDFVITGTASGCSATPSASSTLSVITVIVSCTSDGTVSISLTQNSIVDNASNTGPSATTTANTVTIAPVVTTTAIASTSSTSTTTVPSPAQSSSTTVTPQTTVVQSRTTSPTSTTIPARNSAQETLGLATTTTTSTSTTSSTTTTSTLPPLALPKTEVGQGAALIGGKQVSAEITRENNEVGIKVGPISGRLWGTDANGGKVALDADGRIRVGNGDSITVELAGFDAASTTEVRLYSSPVLLGYTEVSATGLLIGSYEIPEEMESGNHHLVFAGTNKGEDVTISLSVAVGSDTGSTPWLTIFLLIPLLIAVVAGLALPAIARARKAK